MYALTIYQNNMNYWKSTATNTWRFPHSEIKIEQFSWQRNGKRTSQNIFGRAYLVKSETLDHCTPFISRLCPHLWEVNRTKKCCCLLFFFLPLTYFTLTQYASDSVWRILRRIFVLWCNRNVFEVLACFMLLSLTCLSLFHLKGVPRWSRVGTMRLKYFWRRIHIFMRLWFSWVIKGWWHWFA